MKIKIYDDESLRIASDILHSERGSMRKAAVFLDCCPQTAEKKIKEYENENLRRENETLRHENEALRQGRGKKVPSLKLIPSPKDTKTIGA